MARVVTDTVLVSITSIINVVVVWILCYSAVFFDFSSMMCISEFQQFVQHQEACRKRWLDTQTAADRLTASIAESERENVALKTKLKHARCVFYLVLRFLPHPVAVACEVACFYLF